MSDITTGVAGPGPVGGVELQVMITSLKALCQLDLGIFIEDFGVNLLGKILAILWPFSGLSTGKVFRRWLL